jgi:predicted class III extradiol MEMO1 family dioxygenase
MEASNKLTKKFTNHGIINVDKNTFDTEIFNETVICENVKINGGTAYVSQNYDLKILVLPNTSYNIARTNYIQCYKILKNTKNFSKIKRVFMLGYSHLSIKASIYLSAYNNYESNDKKKIFEIDHLVYSELSKNEKLKNFIEKFEINSFSFTTFVEDSGSIKEKEEEINESFEDNEFTFDIHLALLNYIFDNKIKIVPIWMNVEGLNNSKELSMEMGNYLKTYFQKDDSLFIFSANLTYFGRLYNYFGDPTSDKIKEFKSKSFLREPANEKKVSDYINFIDEEGINLIKTKNADGILKLTNFNYCRELFVCLISLIRDANDLISETISHSIKRFESIDEGFELNMVSFGAIIFLNR